MHHGSEITTWSLWFKVSFHLAELQGKKLMVHLGNAPAHNSRMTRNFFEHNPLKRLPYPPYSPDISLGLLSFCESQGSDNRTRDSPRNQPS
jgi:hypothetical protein